MIDVSVDIFAIVIHCDESILGVEIGNGYSFEKVYLDALPHRDKLIDDYGIPNIEYKRSCLVDENGEFFICLKKHDIFQIHGPDTVSYTHLDVYKRQVFSISFQDAFQNDPLGPV